MTYVKQFDKTEMSWNILSNNIKSNLCFITSLQSITLYWIFYTALYNVPMSTTAIANSCCAYPGSKDMKKGES